MHSIFGDRCRIFLLVLLIMIVLPVLRPKQAYAGFFNKLGIGFGGGKCWINSGAPGPIFWSGDHIYANFFYDYSDSYRFAVATSLNLAEYDEGPQSKMGEITVGSISLACFRDFGINETFRPYVGLAAGYSLWDWNFNDEAPVAQNLGMTKGLINLDSYIGNRIFLGTPHVCLDFSFGLNLGTNGNFGHMRGGMVFSL